MNPKVDEQKILTVYLKRDEVHELEAYYAIKAERLFAKAAKVRVKADKVNLLAKALNNALNQGY